VEKELHPLNIPFSTDFMSLLAKVMRILCTLASSKVPFFSILTAKERRKFINTNKHLISSGARSMNKYDY
jgi:hypothetical protein